MEKKFLTIAAFLLFCIIAVFIHKINYSQKTLLLSKKLSLLAKMPLVTFESSLYEHNSFLDQNILPQLNPIDPLLPIIKKMDFVYER